MKAGRFLRLLRASVFAVACVGLSAVGHVWMSGRPVPGWALFTAVGVMFAAASALAGRRRGFPVIAGLMLAGELGLHGLFTPAQAAAAPVRIDGVAGVAVSSGGVLTGSPAGSVPTGMTGMPMGDMPGMPGMGGMTPSAGPLMGVLMGHGQVGMVAVHVAAGLLCAWWLHRGERIVFGLLMWLLWYGATPLRLLAAAPLAVPRPRAGMSVLPGPDRVGYPRPIAYAIVRRGPPQVSFGF
jgi:hypothetical protein